MAKKMAVKKRLKNDKRKMKTPLSPILKMLIKMLLPISVVVGVAYVSILLSDVWNEKWPVNKIALEGENKQISHHHILRLLENSSTGMLTIDLDDLRKKSLTNPWIKSIEIKKKWPETLIFNVDEYLPIGLVNNHYLLENGKLVEIENLEGSDNLLTLNINQTWLEEIKELAKLITELDAIKQDFLSHQLVVERFVIDDTNSWSVELENRLVINVGRKYQHKRIERFLQVYAEIENKQLLQAIDLRYSNGLAVKLMKNSAEAKQNG